MLFVFLSTPAGNEDIVNIGVSKGRPRRTWLIKCCKVCETLQRPISRFHWDLVVSSHQVKFKENCRSIKGERGRKVLDMRDGIAVWLGDNLVLCSHYMDANLQTFSYHVEQG